MYQLSELSDLCACGSVHVRTHTYGEARVTRVVEYKRESKLRRARGTCMHHAWNLR
jgi:hypothetical protein